MIAHKEHSDTACYLVEMLVVGRRISDVGPVDVGPLVTEMGGDTRTYVGTRKSRVEIQRIGVKL